MSFTELLKGIAKGFIDVQKARMKAEAKRMQRKAMKTAWTIGLSLMSAVFFVAGVVVLLSRWIALEWVLLGLGVIFAYIALLVNMSK